MRFYSFVTLQIYDYSYIKASLYVEKKVCFLNHRKKVRPGIIHIRFLYQYFMA